MLWYLTKESDAFLSFWIPKLVLIKLKSFNYESLEFSLQLLQYFMYDCQRCSTNFKLLNCKFSACMQLPNSIHSQLFCPPRWFWIPNHSESDKSEKCRKALETFSNEARLKADSNFTSVKVQQNFPWQTFVLKLEEQIAKIDRRKTPPSFSEILILTVISIYIIVLHG